MNQFLTNSPDTHKKASIDNSTSPDGKQVLYFQISGEPPIPNHRDILHEDVARSLDAS